MGEWANTLHSLHSEFLLMYLLLTVTCNGYTWVQMMAQSFWISLRSWISLFPQVLLPSILLYWTQSESKMLVLMWFVLKIMWHTECQLFPTVGLQKKNEKTQNYRQLWLHCLHLVNTIQYRFPLIVSGSQSGVYDLGHNSITVAALKWHTFVARSTGLGVKTT